MKQNKSMIVPKVSNNEKCTNLEDFFPKWVKSHPYLNGSGLRPSRESGDPGQPLCQEASVLTTTLSS